MQSSGLTVLWFVLIVALIPLTLWVLKRSGLVQGGGASLTGGALIKPVAQYNLGPGQRLVTVEVGQGADRTWLVLGVTANQITTVHTMAPQAELPDAGATAMPFASLLQRAGQRQFGKGAQ